MFKKTIALVMAALMACGLAACGGGGESAAQTGTTTESKATTQTEAAADAVVLTYAEVNPIDSTDGGWAKYFKEQVETLTGGSVVIDIQASGVLGAESDVLDGMISGGGTVDLARVSCYAMNTYSCNKSALLGLPFIFESREHFWNFVNSDLGEELKAEPSEAGIGVSALYYLEDGFRSFFFKDPVNDISEMKSKKVRVSTDQIMTGMVEGLGAAPTVVSFNELYTSLQSGVVDGAEQPLPPYESNAFNEVAPYVILDEHTLATSYVVLSDMSKSKLTDDQLQAIQEAGKATEEYCRQEAAKYDEECIARLKEKGVTFVEVADKTPWREACSNVTEQFIPGVENVYQGILDCAK